MTLWAQYTCANVTCDMHGVRWEVELDANGHVADEADERCPQCYGPGVDVEVVAVPPPPAGAP